MQVTKVIANQIGLEGSLLYTPHRVLSNEEYLALAQAFEPWSIERNADNSYSLMPPVSSFFDSVNGRLITAIFNWAEHDGTGVPFGSTAGFDLPDGSNRSPDAAWIRKDRIAALTKAQQVPFIKLAPDFIVELRSPSNTLSGGKEHDLMHKMDLWMQNGVQLGWLIDPMEEKAYIFRQGKPTETITTFGVTLYGETILPGFEIPLAKLRLPIR